MKPRSKNKPRLRLLSLLALCAGTLGAAVYVSNGIGLEQPQTAPSVAAAPERPSYLSPLPQITAEALDSGRIVASAVANDPDTISLATDKVLVSALDAEPAEPEPREPANLFRVTANGLNVRAEPTGASGVLFVLPEGEEVQVAEAEGSWMRVISTSGESGWAFGKYLSPVAAE